MLNAFSLKHPMSADLTAGTQAAFLTAEMRHIAMLNFVADPSWLRPLVPAGTELDLWNGTALISLIGLRFLKSKTWGIPIPFHACFEQVNLRFYVCRREGSEIRKGVVFVREVVPRNAIAMAARLVYNERYVCLPMSHSIQPQPDGGLHVEYRWRSGRGWNHLRLRAGGEPRLPDEGSEEQFIVEHYCGYVAQRDGGCLEYRLAHPSWRLTPSRDAVYEGDAEELYGRELATVIRGEPSSAFLAEGSAVTVYRGKRLS